MRLKNEYTGVAASGVATDVNVTNSKKEPMKAKVVISRKWKQQKIEIKVVQCEKQIALEMSLSDFLHALSKEYGNPATTLTVAGHEKKLKAASKVVIKEMHDKSAEGL